MLKIKSLQPPPPRKSLTGRFCEWLHERNNAFTLAEVLITLGIIGVIAALTIPSLVTKFRRQSAETQLKKFYTVINQAIEMGKAEYGDIEIEDKDKVDYDNAEYISSWMKKYITRYLKTLKSEKQDAKFYEVALNDGSGFIAEMYPPYDETNTSHLYIFYCRNFNKCNKNIVDGENTFWFTYDTDRKQILPLHTYNAPSSLKENFCYNGTNKSGCAAIIMKNNWRIPDDYPWIR